MFLAASVQAVAFLTPVLHIIYMLLLMLKMLMLLMLLQIQMLMLVMELPKTSFLQLVLVTYNSCC